MSDSPRTDSVVTAIIATKFAARMPLLPKLLKIDLSDCTGFPMPGCVAYAEPFDEEQYADHLVMLNQDPRLAGDSLNLPQVRLMWAITTKIRLRRIEGLAMVTEDGTEVPFDATNEEHMGALQMPVAEKVATALFDRANLKAADVKN